MKIIRTVSSLFFLALVINVAAQKPNEKSLLWEISGNGLKEKSYLYGTFHLLCPEDLKMSEGVYKHLKGSKKLFLELDLANPMVSVEMQQKMPMKDGHMIREYVDSLTYKQMSDSMRSIVGMPLDFLQAIKPILISSFLYPKILGCAPGSPEIKLSLYADSLGIPVEGLETVDDQMAVLDAIPYDKQTEMLKEYLLNKDELKKETERMLGLYRAADIAGMHDLVAEDESEYGDHAEDLLYKRNAKWISAISDNSKKQACFYAVGAGHLGGEKGVIALLREAGFTVKPLK